MSTLFFFFFFFNDTATTEIYTLSLHDALPISSSVPLKKCPKRTTTSSPLTPSAATARLRSEEHTSELQSQSNLVCRLLLEKKKKKNNYEIHATTIHYHHRISETNIIHIVPSTR